MSTAEPISTKPGPVKVRDVGATIARLRAAGLEQAARRICAEEMVWLQHVIRRIHEPDVCAARWRLCWHLVRVDGLEQREVARILGVHRNSVARAIAHHERRLRAAAERRAA